jgi:hypothetical protein
VVEGACEDVELRHGSRHVDDIRETCEEMASGEYLPDLGLAQALLQHQDTANSLHGVSHPGNLRATG